MSGGDRPVGMGNPRMGWGSDVAAELLRRLGVEYVALNPGASYRGLHDSLVNYLGNQAPQMLLCLHEDHAVAIAHGYAMVAGRPMAAALHSNVGLMHGLMGIFNAWCDRVPMLVLGATGPVDAAMRRPWIDWIHTSKDQGALLRHCTKWDDEPRSVPALVESMLRAWRTTCTPPRGPVYVCLDAGLQESALDAEPTIPDLARFTPPPAPAPPADTLQRAADVLLAARAPLVMAGRASRDRAAWDARIRLAELLDASVVTDLKSGPGFPTSHGLHLCPPRARLADAGREALVASDGVLVLDWVDLAGEVKLAGGPDAVRGPIVHCSLDEYLATGYGMECFGLPPRDIAILAEAHAVVAGLLPIVEARLEGRARWDGRPRGTRPPLPDLTARHPGEPIAPADLGPALRAAKGERALCIAHVPIGWDATHYDFDDPLDYLTGESGAGLGGTPGLAVGAALAMRARDPGRLVVAVVGDGDFLQGSTALWTAARYRIPALFVVSNNRSNFNDEVHQQAVANDRGRPVENRWIGQRIDDPAVDLVALARSQGVEGIGPIERVDDLVAALERGLAIIEAGTAVLVDVRVTPGYSTTLMTRGSGEGARS